MFFTLPEEKRYFCDKCNRPYIYLKTLRFHQRHECGKEPRFACTVSGCTYKTKLKGNWKMHVIRKHATIASKLFDKMK